MLTTRGFSRAATVLVASASALTIAAPALAQPNEGTSQNSSRSVSTSYFGLRNVCAVVTTKIIADDRGTSTRIDTGSYASFRVFTCSTGVTLPNVTGTLTWTVTAKGWAIDSCGPQVPAGFACSGSGTSQTWSYEYDFKGTGRRTIGSAESVAFRDGTVGDTTSVRSHAQVVINGIGLAAAVEVEAS